MTGNGKTVLWIGLVLIVLNLLRHWSEIRATLFQGGTSSSGGGGGGGLPSLPFPTWPGTDIPLLAHVTPAKAKA